MKGPANIRSPNGWRFICVRFGLDCKWIYAEIGV